VFRVELAAESLILAKAIHNTLGEPSRVEWDDANVVRHQHEPASSRPSRVDRTLHRDRIGAVPRLELSAGRTARARRTGAP